ncbi:MAG: DEAD/DEAH box helicase [Spirochaetales bacterium]|nr:DEAD/DEAH box helicase [Spirochaetales bacterium]
MTFTNLGLRPELLQAVERQGYTRPTPIQLKSIPVILDKKDILGGAQTGTGKTAAFTLPLLQNLSSNGLEKSKHPRALIIAPTRELANQIRQSIVEYGQFLPYNSAAIFGGVKIGGQINWLRQGLDIVVATPGRLLDHINQKTINLSKVEYLILDEADRMLDMGFIRDIRKIISRLPAKRQNMLFSATYNKEIKKLSTELLHRPVLVEVNPQNSAADTVEQVVYNVEKSQKQHLLSYMIKEESWYQVLVFTRTKYGASKLSKQLNKAGIKSSDIHGNKSQNARTKALKEFKEGQLQALVATDIAARGLDIAKLTHVVNFDLPNAAEDYIHRIGRTGRAGADGQAISFCSHDERSQLWSIEKLLDRKIPVKKAEGFVPPPAPVQNQQNNQGRPATRNRAQNSGRPQARTQDGSRPQSRSQSNNRPTDSRRKIAGGKTDGGKFYSPEKRATTRASGSR